MTKQLKATKAVLTAALEEFGFNLAVIVTVVEGDDGHYHFECALEGQVPPAAAPFIASGLREVADQIASGMARQTAVHRARGVS